MSRAAPTGGNRLAFTHGGAVSRPRSLISWEGVTRSNSLNDPPYTVTRALTRDGATLRLNVNLHKAMQGKRLQRRCFGGSQMHNEHLWSEGWRPADIMHRQPLCTMAVLPSIRPDTPRPAPSLVATARRTEGTMQVKLAKLIENPCSGETGPGRAA